MKLLMLHEGGLDNALPLFSKDVYAPGLINWVKIFNGEVKKWQDVGKEELEQYDVVYINLTGVEKVLPKTVREYIGESRSTKIVVSLDYSVECYQIAIPDFQELLESIAAADLVFASEPYQKEFLQYIVDNHIKNPRCKEVPLIGHPCPTQELNKFKKNDGMNVLAISFHRYDRHLHIPSMLAQWLDVPRYLFNFNPELVPYVRRAFHIVSEPLPWKDYIELLSRCRYGLEYTHIHSLGRFAMECACLRIPLVATDTIYAARECYPTTTHNHTKLSEIRKSLERIIGDEGFREELVREAEEKVEHFSYGACRERLLKALYP